MMVYDIIPLKGVGPVLFGMHRKEVQSVMGMPTKSFKKTHKARSLTDAFHEGGFQVFFDDQDRVEYIELSSPDDSFIAVYRSKAVFQTQADDLVEFISDSAPFDPDAPEIGYAFVFPQLELSVWRPILPETDRDAEGQYFSTIGVGKCGYYSQEYC